MVPLEPTMLLEMIAVPSVWLWASMFAFWVAFGTYYFYLKNKVFDVSFMKMKVY